MNHDSTTTLNRLLALFAEAEQVLPQSAASEDLRDAFAIVRGYLDLGRLYGEPVNIDDLERMMARIANFIGDASFQKRFLTQLRTVTASIPPLAYQTLWKHGPSTAEGHRPEIEESS